MPFRKLEMKESRMQFVVRAASGAESLSELCREFGISRPIASGGIATSPAARSLTWVS